MAKEHRLERRGRTYYLRAVIPAAIRHLYPARQSREIRKSLRTADKRMARVLCQRMSVQLEQEFQTKLAAVSLPRITTRTEVTLAEERQVSCVRACRLDGISRAGSYRKSTAAEQSALRMRIREIAYSRPRFGYQRIHIVLQREGWAINRKRAHRLY